MIAVARVRAALSRLDELAHAHPELLTDEAGERLLTAILEPEPSEEERAFVRELVLRILAHRRDHA